MSCISVNKINQSTVPNLKTFIIFEPFAFKHPTTILIAGPTMSGKTHFVMKTLKFNQIQPKPNRLIWIYGEWQQAYDEARVFFPMIEFYPDLTEDLYESINAKERNLLILDDKMSDENGSKFLSKIFTQGAHLRNLTVIFIVQNLFHQGKNMRTISLNCHYIIVFQNPRDKGQIQILGSQIYPQKSKFLVCAYRDATAQR